MAVAVFFAPYAAVRLAAPVLGLAVRGVTAFFPTHALRRLESMRKCDTKIFISDSDAVRVGATVEYEVRSIP